MKILVTGTKGQVSQCLQARATDHDDVDLVAIGRPALDLLKPNTIDQTIRFHRPDIVVSAAAYTAVDRAEDEPEIAFAVNGAGAGAVAAAAKAIGAPVIHLSTDHVFSGKAGRPYREDDVPDPINVYGASKLAGERAVAAANKRHVILRTAWVYSPFGRNFYTTILKLSETQNEIAVVCDQLGNPTSAFALADFILQVSRQLLGKEDASHYGVFHAAGSEAMSWADFAERIMEESRARTGPFAAIRLVTTTERPTKAKRPPDARLVGKRGFAYCAL
ncbi:MAG: dTDP-4-dehydrorhamnose reductase [Alphaproteobacteria bacterium]|nr:dTDP-4-dehydrorhamnose reductase [Alphaproteobacteria bacterium]